jgi:hypothetical protein
VRWEEVCRQMDLNRPYGNDWASKPGATSLRQLRRFSHFSCLNTLAGTQNSFRPHKDLRNTLDPTLTRPGVRDVGSGKLEKVFPEILRICESGCWVLANGSSRPERRVRMDGPSRLIWRPRSRILSTIAWARSWRTVPHRSSGLFVVKIMDRRWRVLTTWKSMFAASAE